MTWTRRGILVAGAIAATAPSLARAERQAGAEADHQPLWLIRKGEAKVYLTGDGGSVTNPWRSARIEAAFDESAAFWKETPDPTPADRAKYVAKGVDRTRPLSSWLTPPEQARIAAAAQTAGISFAAIEPLLPWLAAIVLSSAYAQREKAAASDPLAVLSARAKAANKPTRSEFSDADELIAWAAGMPAAAQVQYVSLIIDGHDAPPADLARRQAAWAAGDLRPETAEVLRMRRTYPELYAALVIDRNRRWPERIRKMLADGGTTFVLVGSDHLLGPDSTLVQLRSAGMPARRI
jgi:uncharacterized protein YbaP (TraB family)